MIFKAFLFAIMGLGLEVVETAILDYPKAKNNLLMGYSSMLYAPFYAIFPMLYFHYLSATLFAWPFYARAPIYAVSFWVVEYCCMGLLRLIFGKSPSEESYYKSPWNVHGLIRLDLGPVWVCFGFIFEWMYRNLACI